MKSLTLIITCPFCGKPDIEVTLSPGGKNGLAANVECSACFTAFRVSKVRDLDIGQK